MYYTYIYVYIYIYIYITCTYGRLLDDRVSTNYYIYMLRTPDSGHIGSSLGLLYTYIHIITCVCIQANEGALTLRINSFTQKGYICI